MDRLTQMQQRFVDHFAQGMSGAQAARLAGCGRGERVTACRWLKKPAIRRAIEHQREVMRFESGISKGKLLDAAMDNFLAARRKSSAGGMIRSVELMAKMSGHL